MCAVRKNYSGIGDQISLCQWVFWEMRKIGERSEARLGYEELN